MQKIKIFPAPHVEVRVHVSDGMAADLRECPADEGRMRSRCLNLNLETEIKENQV